MNRFSQKVIIVSRNLDGSSLAIMDDSPNSQNFLPAKLSSYTVISSCDLVMTIVLLWTLC